MSWDGCVSEHSEPTVHSGIILGYGNDIHRWIRWRDSWFGFDAGDCVFDSGHNCWDVGVRFGHCLADRHRVSTRCYFKHLQKEDRRCQHLCANLVFTRDVKSQGCCLLRAIMGEFVRNQRRKADGLYSILLEIRPYIRNDKSIHPEHFLYQRLFRRCCCRGGAQTWPRNLFTWGLFIPTRWTLWRSLLCPRWFDWSLNCRKCQIQDSIELRSGRKLFFHVWATHLYCQNGWSVWNVPTSHECIFEHPWWLPTCHKVQRVSFGASLKTPTSQVIYREDDSKLELIQDGSVFGRQRWYRKSLKRSNSSRQQGQSGVGHFGLFCSSLFDHVNPNGDIVCKQIPIHWPCCFYGRYDTGCILLGRYIVQAAKICNRKGWLLDICSKRISSNLSTRRIQAWRGIIISGICSRFCHTRIGSVVWHLSPGPAL